MPFFGSQMLAVEKSGQNVTGVYIGSFPMRSVAQWLSLPQNDQDVVFRPPLTNFCNWGSVFSSFPTGNRKSSTQHREDVIYSSGDACLIYQCSEDPGPSSFLRDQPAPGPI